MGQEGTIGDPNNRLVVQAHEGQAFDRPAKFTKTKEKHTQSRCPLSCCIFEIQSLGCGILSLQRATSKPNERI